MQEIIVTKEHQVLGNINNQNQSNNFKNDNLANSIGNNLANNLSESINQENVNISQNVNLKELHLNIQGISPGFNKDITEYYLIVSEFINDIEIDAIPEEQSANISITGNKNLQMGSNKIEIKVKSGDEKNSKTYVINVSKLKNENLGNCFLENLAIENVNITPEFNSEIFNYFAEVGSEIDNLNILAVPQNEKSKIEINGNNNLQFGENTVEILVTAEDLNTVKKYSIQVHKKTQDEENVYTNNANIINKTQSDLKKHENKLGWWILIIAILVIIVTIVFLLWKRNFK